MTYTVILSGQAKKQLAKITKTDRKSALLIWAFLENDLDGSANPRNTGNAKKLQGTENGWRWRIQRYRILGRIIDDTLVVDVFKIGARKDVYKNLGNL